MINLFNTRTLGLGLIAASALALAAPASAQSSDEPIGVAVSYAGLDIHQPADAMVLLHRIEIASVTACGGAPDPRVLADRAPFETCRKSAIGAAVEQMRSPVLAAMAGQQAQTIFVAGR